MDALGIERFHLVGCKYGGTIARALAARRPEHVRTLTVIVTPQASRPGGEVIPALVMEFEQHGLSGWAKRTMGMRLGSDFPPEGVEYWIDFMSRTAVSSMIGFNERINYIDIRSCLPRLFFSEDSFPAQESLPAASSAATFTARVPKPQLRQEWVDIRVYFV